MKKAKGKVGSAITYGLCLLAMIWCIGWVVNEGVRLKELQAANVVPTFTPAVESISTTTPIPLNTMIELPAPKATSPRQSKPVYRRWGR